MESLYVVGFAVLAVIAFVLVIILFNFFGLWLRARIANADLNPQGEQIDNKGMGNPMGNRALSEMHKVVRDWRLEVTLAGLEAVGNHLAGMPGRKILVWITSGVPIRISTNGMPKLYKDAILKTARRLATQGIAIYPGDAKGLHRAYERPGNRGTVLGAVQLAADFALDALLGNAGGTPLPAGRGAGARG